jgi:1-acyl-sn-glycerol-3-phosphate acyltransferase
MDRWKFKPAGDFGMPAMESLASLKREAGLTSLAAHFLWGSLTRAYFQVFHRLKIEGLERLPAQPPFVLVANHTSHLDALVLACALPLRFRIRAFPIAAGDTFFTKPAKAFFAAMLLNALPMWRKKCGPHALEVLREKLVSDPAIFILFPEGTRSRDGRLANFKAGVGRMVAGSDVPVVPCHFGRCFESLPADAARPRFCRIRLKIGSARVFSALPDERQGWDSITEMLAADVAALGG